MIQAFLSLLVLRVFKWFSQSFLYSYFWPVNDAVLPFFTHTSGRWMIQSFLSLLILLASEWFSPSFLYSYFWPVNDSVLPFFSDTSGLWTTAPSPWTVNHSYNPVQLRAPQLHGTHVYSAVQQRAVWTTAAQSSLMKIHSQGATRPDNMCALLQIPKRSQQHPSEHSPVVTVFLSPGSSYLEPAPCFCPSCYLCQFFQIFLENLSLFKSLYFSPIALIYDSVCVCVCVCVSMCVCIHVGCVENMCFQRMCKRLGPARVRRSMYPLLLLCANISTCRLCTKQLF